MKTDQKQKLSKKGAEMLENLKKSVANTLKKKKRLGQYAVVWGEGGIEVFGDELECNE